MSLMNDPIHRDIQKQEQKYCRFLKGRALFIDYKDPVYLARLVNNHGKILPRRLTGTSLKYQHRVSQAIKRARHLALLPYTTDKIK